MRNLKISAGHIRRSFVATVLCLLAVLCANHAYAATSSRFYQVSGSGIASEHSASAAAACQNWIVKNGSATYTYVGITDIPPTYFNCNVKYTSSGQAATIAGGSSTTTCPDGQDVILPSATYPKCGVVQTPEDMPCAGYPNVAAAAAADNFLQNPVCKFGVNGPVENGVAVCTGTIPGGRTSSYDIACNGPVKVDPYPTPKPIPTPAPLVETSFPRCQPGQYLYTDGDGTKYCSGPTPEPSCASGNVGTVNGMLACLPANPAPATTQAAATAAAAAAQTAKDAAPGSEIAIAAAEQARAAAQRAVDAAASMPSDTTLIVKAQEAVDAANRAAAYAGLSSPSIKAPDGNGSGGGGGTSEGCGLPGKPKCQIDETGTPAGIGTALDASKTALQATVDSIKTAANDAASANGKDTSISWMPVVPEGTCQEQDLPIPVPGGGMLKTDICKYTSYVTVGFELLWAAFFGFAIMGLVASATSKPHA